MVFPKRCALKQHFTILLYIVWEAKYVFSDLTVICFFYTIITGSSIVAYKNLLVSCPLVLKPTCN
jgi:hypothetical protein